MSPGWTEGRNEDGGHKHRTNRHHREKTTPIREQGWEVGRTGNSRGKYQLQKVKTPARERRERERERLGEQKKNKRRSSTK